MRNRISFARMFLPHLGVETLHLMGGQSERQDAAPRGLYPYLHFPASAVSRLGFGDVGIACLPQQQACGSHGNDEIFVNAAKLSQEQRKSKAIDHCLNQEFDSNTAHTVVSYRS